jgi:membrane fusion protein (multidrug efflux system)
MAPVALLEQWAAYVAPIFDAHQLELMQVRVARADANRLFRVRAIEAHEDRGLEGEVLLRAPAWSLAAYWLVLVAIVTALVYTCVETIGQFATGPALITFGGRTAIQAAEPGVVESVAALPGATVEAGDVVVRLACEREQDALARAQRSYEHSLVVRLRNPADQAAEQAFAEWTQRRQEAMDALERRSIRAKVAGVIGDVRVKPGQMIAPGDTLLTIGDGDAEAQVLAFVPAQARPSLAPGQRMSLDLDGFLHATQHLTVDEIAEEGVGPTEVRRLLGSARADALAIGGGAFVVVRAKFDEPTFEADGETWSLYAGMTGRAHVRTHDERLLFVVAPQLKDWFVDDSDR